MQLTFLRKVKNKQNEYHSVDDCTYKDKILFEKAGNDEHRIPGCGGWGWGAGRGPEGTRETSRVVMVQVWGFAGIRVITLLFPHMYVTRMSSHVLKLLF